MKIFYRIAVFSLSIFVVLASANFVKGNIEITEQPLSKIAIHSAVFALRDDASIKAYPTVLGSKVKIYFS